jgi:RNA polymerase-interacting CarD/CdnL/TRCF family regulator
VASERQILANRRNAQKSKGPKTVAGKKRSSQNAYKYGLSLPMRNVQSCKQLEELLQLFEGGSDPEIRGLAERAADAEADLARVRKVKTTVLERALMQRGNRAEHDLLDSARPLLEGEEEQTFVNAVQHILPELVKINRYEKRAASRRDRTIHELASMKTTSKE